MQATISGKGKQSDNLGGSGASIPQTSPKKCSCGVPADWSDALRTYNHAITPERLRDLLAYDPNTGLFKWKRRCGRAGKGCIAGSDDGRGYIKIKIEGERYAAHRLAWLYVTGSWPEQDLDHIDGNPSNNTFSNLRQVTHAQNMRNRKPNSVMKGKPPTSALKGVSWCSWTGRWRAQINHQGIKIELGRFDRETDAGSAYRGAERRLRGKFARGAA